MSLLILHQLEDKQRALDFYINFLKEVGIWQRVRALQNLMERLIVIVLALLSALGGHNQRP